MCLLQTGALCAFVERAPARCMGARRVKQIVVNGVGDSLPKQAPPPGLQQLSTSAAASCMSSSSLRSGGPGMAARRLPAHAGSCTH